MTLTALALVLIAAVLHTAWNLILKQAQERAVVGWWAMLIGSLIFAPLIAVAWPLPAVIWPYIVVSACVEAAYMLLLSRAYQHGDFSLVYPIARGSAPIFLAIWSVLFLHDPPALGGVLGILLLIAGLAAIGIGQLRNRAAGTPIGGAAIALAVGVAFTISIYSAIDAAAVRLADPLAYNALVFAATALAQAPFVLIGKGKGIGQAVAVLRMEWCRAVPIGVLMLATYGLVLIAYAQSTASYVGAIRELSIVLAAIAGWRWLGEGFGKLRMLGAALTFCGVLAIAALG
ncbi:MAG: DMT family transporter [Roseiflexaceae bacterium]